MTRAGARVTVDDVFLGGAASQARVRAALEGDTSDTAPEDCAALIAERVS